VAKNRNGKNHATADAVTMAFVHQNRDSHSWHHSMMELIGFDAAHKGRLMRGGYVSMRGGTDGLSEARNKGVMEFLADETLRHVPWLLWVDTDMGFAPDSLDRLMAVADPDQRPIVGGLCFMQMETDPDGVGGFNTRAAPTVYDWIHSGDEQGFGVRWDYPVNTLLRCDGTGSAFVLIHRRVLELMSDKLGPVWYDRVPNPTTKKVIGEDLSFCLRARSLGIPVHIHTAVRTTHHKEVWLGEDRYWQERAMIPTGTVVQSTAVIVPTINRPSAALPFMQSLKETTGAATAYAVIKEGDSSGEAWGAAGATVLRCQKEGFAVKANYGYAQTTEPWLFFVGDDVRFWPGWLEQAQDVARAHNAHVIGTNDLGNPRVMSGEHATHWLASRNYITKYGASWDGPGIVCHEGYEHWCCDDEVVAAARQRGTYAHALGSRVEHLHPFWGKGDETSNRPPSEEAVKRDQKLFQRRLQQSLTVPAEPVRKMVEV
jgi:hypothetical protein